MFDTITDATPRVVSLDSAPDDPRIRAERARKEYHARMVEMSDQAREAGLPIDGLSPLGRMFHAGHSYAEVWERRAHRLDRALRMLLASDAPTAEQRADVAAVLFGRKAIGRDSKTLSAVEADLVADYRSMSTADKQMLRTLLDRLATRGGEK